MRCVPKFVVSLSLSVALCVVPTAAVAAQTPVAQSVSPMVALSLFGSPASAAALCSNQAAASTASAVAAQTPANGCVLPYVDPAPPPPVVETPIQPAPIAAPGGFGISPLLLGLLGIAGLAAIIASQKDDNNGRPPVSPN